VEEITMEYSDGTVDPGETITAEGDDLGSATYDSDGDGVADSVIIGQDEYTVVVTDDDGDGQADSVTAYDAGGNEVHRGSAGGATDGSTGDDGSKGDSGSSGDGASGDGASGDTGSSGDQGSAGTGDHGAGGSITVVDEQGRPVEVGPPTADMDGDGTPDTAVVRNDDGSTTGFTDRNGDGEADQITQISADNQVTISIADGNGGWTVAATGHLDPSGEFVEDDGSGSGGSDGTDGTGSADGTDGGDNLVADVGDAGQNDAGQPDGALAAIVYTDANGQSYELGAPTEDFDGDGTADTVVTTLANGTVVGYSDVDGDGQTDQVTQIDPDGTVTIGVPDGNGGWEEAATGHLGPNGEFVAHAESTSV
jgi:hypothetical protein